MSKYTTELRYICETESRLGTGSFNSVEEIIENSLTKIFNFSYPIFDENYRSILETKIIRHFYTREIGEETYGLWKLRLNTRLNEIMPYYNKMYESELLEFNPLYTSNLTTTRKITDEGNRTENETIGDKTSLKRKETGSNTGSNTTNGTQWNLYSDTPQGSVQNVDNETYLTNATKNTDNTTVSLTGSNTTDIEDTGSLDRVRGVGGTATNTQDYLENVVGFNGTNASKLLKEYRETFLNIDMMVINDLENLFMQLW